MKASSKAFLAAVPAISNIFFSRVNVARTIDLTGAVSFGPPKLKFGGATAPVVRTVPRDRPVGLGGLNTNASPSTPRVATASPSSVTMSTGDPARSGLCLRLNAKAGRLARDTCGGGEASPVGLARLNVKVEHVLAYSCSGDSP